MPPKKRRSINKPKILCGQCKLEVKEEEDGDIQCDKCAKTFHSLCTKLDKRQFEHLMANESEQFICHLCDGGNESVKSELLLIKTKLNKLDRLDQLDSLQNSVSYMSQQFDDMMKALADNNKKLLVVQKENKNLRAEINNLKDTVKYLNDERVKNDCLVTGIEKVENMNAVGAVVSMMNKVGVDLTAGDIDDAHFMYKKPNQKKQTMVVKFNSAKAKQKLMASKNKLREKDETKNIYVNDFLSRETLALLNHAQSVKTIGYRRVYARFGRVYVKMNEFSRPKLIRCADDVDNLLLEGATTSGRRLMRPAVEENLEESDADANTEYLSPS